MALINWKPKHIDPFHELDDLQDKMFGLTLFPNLDKGFGALKAWPAVDVAEDKDHVTVKADLPGLKQDEISVNVDGDVLTIQGERQEEQKKEGKNYHRIERSYGSFQRSLQLGPDVDLEKIKASYKNGVLEIQVPKTEKAKPKQIKVDIE